MTMAGLAGSDKASPASEEGSGMALIPPSLTLTLCSSLIQDMGKRKKKLTLA